MCLKFFKIINFLANYHTAYKFTFIKLFNLTFKLNLINLVILDILKIILIKNDNNVSKHLSKSMINVEIRKDVN